MCKWTRRGKGWYRGEAFVIANFHLEVKAISRGRGHSVTGRVNYITGERLRDIYNGNTYYKQRDDILYQRIFQPDNAPVEFHDLQYLCNEIDKAEVRCDARTARELIGSLPNELPPSEMSRMVNEFIYKNFVNYGLCAIAAIHEKRNETDPSRNNPHVHIIVSTRTVGPNGFSKKKDREHDERKYINIWREQWADVQNRAYERNRLDIRVSHESLEIQGKRDREPTIHLSRIDWQREQRGERTSAGDRKREIAKRNEEREHQIQICRSRRRGIDLSR